MSRYPCEMESVSAVLVGSFCPPIIQPSWLARHGLIRDEEADAASIDIIRPEISLFTVGVLRVHVDLSRFQVETSATEATGAVRDLVVGTLQILDQTPVHQLGMNRNMHFRMPSEKEWHTVGHRLAPKEPWAGLLDDAGTRAVVVQGRRPGGSARFLRIQVEPSTKVQPGVYVSANEHHEGRPGAVATELLGVLEAQWDTAQAYARELGRRLLEGCLTDG